MKKFLVILAAVAAVAIGGYYLFFSKSDVCKNVIPEDAKAVLIFDGKEAIKQIDFSLSDIIDFIKQRSDSDDEDLEVGIDFLSPMYGFLSSDNYGCGVFALSDAEAFEKAISEKTTVESQRGFKWVYSNDILACFDSDKALVMGPVSKSESDRMRSKMAEWMSQGSHKVPMLSSIQDKKGILRFRTNLEILPERSKSQFKAFYKNIDLSKIFLNVAFNLREKAFVLTYNAESEDEEYTKLVSEWSVYNRPIQANQFKTPYERPLGLLVFNTDGEALLKKLGEIPTYGMILPQLSSFCNVDLMLQAIDGNVTVAIDEISDDSVKFLFTAQVKNKDFMAKAGEWESTLANFGMECQQIEGDNYMLNANDVHFCLGVRNDMLYFASDYDVAKRGGTFTSLKDGSSLSSLIKGKLFYFSLDMKKLNEILAKSGSLARDESVQKIFSYLDRLNMSSNESKVVEIELTTNKKISDIIKENVKK